MLRAKVIYEIRCLYCKVNVHIPLSKYIKKRPHNITCPRCGKTMIFMVESEKIDLEPWVKTYEATMQTVLMKSLTGRKVRLILKKPTSEGT